MVSAGDLAPGQSTTVMVDPVTGETIDEKNLAKQLLEQSREQGVGLIGSGGLLSGPTKTVPQTALEAELTEHLGHEHGQPALNAFAITFAGRLDRAIH
jgi:hypothetical protein